MDNPLQTSTTTWSKLQTQTPVFRAFFLDYSDKNNFMISSRNDGTTVETVERVRSKRLI
jgi:hypothetical protein